MVDRSLLLSYLVTNNKRGFEIGPLLSPFISKKDSNVIYVDRLTTSELREKFHSDLNVRIEDIVEVDVIVGNGDFIEGLSAMRADGFDFAIASHVIEHIPNFVGWLEQLARLVKSGGHLLLVVPDKRFTFDYLRHVSTLSAAVDAYLQDYRAPTPGQIFDYNSLACAVDKTLAWSGSLIAANLELYSNPLAAFELSRVAQATGLYQDSHCWVFTPSTFLELCADLVDLKLLQWRLVFFADTRLNEEDFGVVLVRCDDIDDHRRSAEQFRVASAQANSAACTRPDAVASADANLLHDRRWPWALINSLRGHTKSRKPLLHRAP